MRETDPPAMSRCLCCSSSLSCRVILSVLKASDSEENLFSMSCSDRFSALQILNGQSDERRAHNQQICTVVNTNKYVLLFFEIHICINSFIDSDDMYFLPISFLATLNVSYSHLLVPMTAGMLCTQSSSLYPRVIKSLLNYSNINKSPAVKLSDFAV